MPNPFNPFELQNPFVYNPSFDQPQDSTFIQKGIENGIEKGITNVGDKILHAGQVKTQSLAQSLPEIITLAFICYLIYLGYKIFIKRDSSADFSKLYPMTMIYIIFRLVWKVVLRI